MPQSLESLAAEIVRNVGQEFPAPWQEMAQRQYIALVEECVELEEAIEIGDLARVREEVADAMLTVYMLAHYLNVGLSRRLEGWHEGSGPVSPKDQVTLLAGPLRRYLGIARRSGPLQAAVQELIGVALAVRSVAYSWDIDVPAAIEEKSTLIFTRGWRESDSTG